MHIIWRLSVIMIFLTLLGRQVNATVLTFDDLAGPDNEFRESYSSSGFTLTSDSVFNPPFNFGAWGTSKPDYNTSTALFNNFDSATTMLTRDGGGLFSFNLIDLDYLFTTDSAVTIPVLFKGSGLLSQRDCVAGYDSHYRWMAYVCVFFRILLSSIS